MNMDLAHNLNLTLGLGLDILLISALLLVSWRLLGASDLFQAIVLFISFGLFLALAWLRLQAPDIALAEAAVGAGLTGVLLFGTFKGLEPDADNTSPSPAPKPCRLDRTAECPRRMHYILAGVFSAMFTALLVFAVLELPRTGSGLTGLAADSMDDSGVAHPITAVLLNFRLFDTWLELGVLLLALVGILGVHGCRDLKGMRPRHDAGPLLFWLVRGLIPVLILTTVHLLWLGDHAPGGAFQAGVVLASGLVLLWLSGHPSITILSSAAWMPCLVAGFGSILLMGVMTALAPNLDALEYPQEFAKVLILVLEFVATLSIGVILASLAVQALAGGDDKQTKTTEYKPK